jgi:hypothetical protein
MNTQTEAVWAYKVKWPYATNQNIADATGVSLRNVEGLMAKIGTPEHVRNTPSPKTATWSRAEILDTAKEYVTKDRAATHGDMEDNFGVIAQYWSVHLNHTVTSVDVAVMMSLLKVARIRSNPQNADNWIDAAGYVSCGGEIATKPVPV